MKLLRAQLLPNLSHSHSLMEDRDKIILEEQFMDRREVIVITLMGTQTEIKDQADSRSSKLVNLD